MREILKKYQVYGDSCEVPQIQRAYEYARDAHAGVLRKSGEHYIVHPVQAALELMVIEPDATTLVATLLHDTVSNGSAGFADIEEIFGPEVRRIVEALDKVGMVKYRGDKSTIDRLQRTLIAMAQDVRSIFVKFADRIDNLRTLQYHGDTKKAHRIANESLSIYAPIATRLGLYFFKDTMETLALRELDPTEYMRVTGELADYTLEQEQFLTQSVESVRNMLPEKYRQSVSYRVKKPYSIYRKFKQSGATSIREIYDVFALRIVVDDISDCYAVLGIIHGHFTPLSDRFKDFIAVPKPNGYQSLHTTVLGFDGYRQPIEIQIRTREMDTYADQGTAAHVLYKVYGDAMQKAQGYQDLIQMTVDTLLEQGSLLGQKISFPTMFIFSPKGDVFELPHRATPIDFAYAVHSDVGYHTIGVRVNGRIAPLDATLSSGDVVEIITSPHAHPVEQWLDFVVSSKAKSHIGIEIKRFSGDRDKIVEKGRLMLMDTFHLAGIPLAPDFSDFTQYYGSTLDAKKMSELLYHIGQGMRKPASFLPQKRNKSLPPHQPKTLRIPEKITVGGVRNIPHQLSQCCKPHFPDALVAVMRGSNKCMIHSVECPSLLRANEQRFIPAYWLIHDGGRVATLEVVLSDRLGALSDLTRILYEAAVNIIDINSTPSWDEEAFTVTINIEVPQGENSLTERLIDRIYLSFPDCISARLISGIHPTKKK